MPDQDRPRLWRFSMRHVLGLFASTIVLIVYLFLVTLVYGWGSDFGNGLGGGLTVVVWASVPTLAVGRRFAVMRRRAMALREAALIVFPTTALLAFFIVSAGMGMRSEWPEVRLSDLQFWLLHLGYIAMAFAFFAGVMWVRAWAGVRGLSRAADQDTPPAP